MKKVLLSVLAVGMLTACSQDETISMQSPTQIAFEGAFVNKATRAVDAADPSTTTASIKTFDVWGYVQKSNGTVFNDVTVTKNGNAWTYSPLQYWAPGQIYHFFALTPDNPETVEKTLSDTPFNNGLGSIKFTNLNGTEDILYATAARETAPTIQDSYEKVKFAFDHLLAKVKFTFKNGFATGYSTIEVTDIKITNAPKQGSVTLGVVQANQAAGENYEWTIEGTEVPEARTETTEEEGTETTVTVLAFGDASGDKTVGDGEEKTTIGIAEGAKFESDNERLTIPAGEEQVYNVTFTIKLYQDQALVLTVNKEVEITGIELVSGHAYNFVATLDPSNIGDKALQPIVFDAEVDEWIEAGDYGFLGVTNVANEEELTAAIAAGGEINLMSDITLNNTLNITKNTTLNLNGKTLTNQQDNEETDVIVVAEGATLTIEGEGTVEAVTGNDGFAVIAEGTLIINSGTFKSGVDADDAPNAVIYARENGKVYVNGGNFPNDNSSKFVLNKKDAHRATTTIEVTGGTFGAFNPGNNAAEGTGTNFLAEGYKSIDNGDGTYTVVEE